MLVSNILMIFSYYLINTVSAQTCKTPNNKPGQCISILTCPELLSLVSKKPVPEDDVKFLQQSQCGYENNQPLVCCPTKITATGVDLLPNADICGIDPKQRIVGGTLVDLGEFNWLTLLEYETSEGRSFHCGGSLINDRYVLTAGHCINKIPRGWRLVGVRLGEHDLRKDKDCEEDEPGFEDCSDPPINLSIEKVIVHEKYNPNVIEQPNDIALLRLSQPVAFTKYVGPICLPIIEELVNSNFVGIDLTAAGWGRTENSTQSDIKLKVRVPVKSKSYCTSRYSRAGVNLLETQLCAGGEEGSDTCTGDSGGPLMHLYKGGEKFNWYLGGVVSFGPDPCGQKNWPGIYTRVNSYIPWIVDHLEP